MGKLHYLAVIMLLTTAIPVSALQTHVVSVEINPNAELLGVVYYLAFGRNDPFVIDRGHYLEDVDEWFGNYSDHMVVGLLREFLSNLSVPRRDYRLMVLEYYLLLCSDPPRIEPMITLDFPWFEEVFLPALRDFAIRTNFMAFYTSHQKDYTTDLRIYEEALYTLPPDEFMANYSGFSNVEYRFEHPFLVAVHGHSFNPVINGTQIWGAGGMLPLVRRTPQRTLWSYKTARDTMFGLPLNRDFINSTRLDELLYLDFVYHELGHDVTVPVLRASKELLRNMTYFVDAIKDDMPYLATYDIHFWSRTGMLYEGFADAWGDFALVHVNPAYASLAMEMQKAWGEFWIENLFRGVQNCALKVRKGEVSNFSSCVPWLLMELKRFASPENVSEVYSREVPVTPVKAFDRGAQKGRVIVVYGTHNPDPSGTEYDKKTAEKIANNLRIFYSLWRDKVEVEVRADDEVTSSELNENLVIVGGPVANSLAEKMQNHFPFQFRKTGGRWYLWRNESWKGEWEIVSFLLMNSTIKRGYLVSLNDVALIASIRNPYNPENYIVWIAGTNRSLTALFQNPTYYLSSYELWSKNGIEMGFYVQPFTHRLS